jgi:predicted PurR-regulated permease PerM
MIYLVLFLGLGLIALVIGPALLEQMSTFAAQAPATYASIRSHLQASTATPLHVIGQRLPPFERLVQMVADVAPQFYQGAVGVTTSIVEVFVYFVTVLVIGFYWTMEVPRVERLVVSLLPVGRRARVLAIWREIESKLGGFMRGEALAMLTIGAASAIGYAVIGLPNVLALAVLAGLLEAVPWIGPVLGFVPALIVAVPLGSHTVLLLVGFTVILQLLENNVLIPRIMQHTVGVSALVSVLAILGFGTLYGLLGVFIAIPMTAVIQVLLDSLLVNAESVGEPEGPVGSPWAGLRTRVQALRQQARVRLRARTSRMGSDAGTVDHVVDAADQQIEVAVGRVEEIIAVAEETSEPMATEERAAVVETLRGATDEIEQAVERVATIVVAEDSLDTSQAALNGGPAGRTLDRATQRIDEAMQDAESMVVAAREESRGARADEEG